VIGRVRLALDVKRGLVVLRLGLGVWCPVQAEIRPLATNMDLIIEAVESTVDRALSDMPLPSTANGPLLLEAGTRHQGDWLLAHVLAERLLQRGIRVTLDSTGVGVDAYRVWYRILALRVDGQGGVLGSTILRSAHATVTFRVSRGDALLWRDQYDALVEDRIPENRVDLLSTEDYRFAKTDLKKQTMGQFAEPVVVSGVLGGLIYMFFSNR